jgi:hypothetical protein
LGSIKIVLLFCGLYLLILIITNVIWGVYKTRRYKPSNDPKDLNHPNVVEFGKKESMDNVLIRMIAFVIALFSVLLLEKFFLS